MGRDKALLPVAGRPMATIPARALVQAGSAELFCVGGDAAGLEAVGLETVADHFPGEGPLGGLITALREAAYDIVVVLTCDLPRVTAAEVTAIVAALGADDNAAVAAPVVDGRPQLLTAAYRREVAVGPLLEAFTAGERAVRRGAEGLALAAVEGLTLSHLADADRPEDLSVGGGS